MPRRLRRAGKWAGLGATLLVAAAYATSTCDSISWFDSSGRGIGIASGVLVFSWSDTSISQRPEWVAVPHEPALYWRFSYEHGRFGLNILGVPLWVPLLAAALPTAWLWHRDRRGNPRNLPGHCGRCGYDLAGLPSGGPCPECGRV